MKTLSAQGFVLLYSFLPLLLSVFSFATLFSQRVVLYQKKQNLCRSLAFNTQRRWSAFLNQNNSENEAANYLSQQLKEQAGFQLLTAPSTSTHTMLAWSSEELIGRCSSHSYQKGKQWLTRLGSPKK